MDKLDQDGAERWQPPPYSEAVRWLVNHDCFVDKSAEYTHLLLDGYKGGKACVDFEDLASFYKEVAKDALNDTQNFLVEQKTAVFPFFMDLDCEDDQDLGDTIIQQWIPTIQEVLRECVPAETDSYVIVCRAPTKEKKGKIKTGFHIHYPLLPVDERTALKLRAFVVDKLHQNFGDRPAENDWTAVVDPSVLMDNGIRILFSWKCERCAGCCKAYRNIQKTMGDCKGKAPGEDWCHCDVCKERRKARNSCGDDRCHYGRISEKRSYAPWGVISKEGVVDTVFSPEDVREHILPLLWQTSVRILDGRPGVTPTPITTPPWFDEATSMCREELQGRRRKHKAKTPQEQRVASTLGIHRDEALDLNSPEHKAVEMVVRTMEGAAGVTHVFKQGEGVHAVYSAWSKHRFCHKIEDAHKSNNVWYSVSIHGLVQRCFNSECKGYASEPRQIPAAAYAVLFPSPAVAAPASKTNPTRVSAANLAYKISYNPHKVARRGGPRRR